MELEPPMLNGTEGGGAGGGYPGPAMRLCPQGPGQPGTQHQDPKQQAQQQAITGENYGTMPVSYSQTARGQNQYFPPRHQRLSTPRLPSVGNMPVPSLSYVPGGQYPVVPPILNMMPQIPYPISQTSGARHQTHAPAPTATAGPTSGNFYAQPPPQGTIFIPQAVSSAYYGPQIIGLPPMRNSTYPANSAPNQIPTQQAPPQQPQVVVSSAGAANQQMMMGMQPGCSPHPQVLASAQQGGGQIPGQPGQLIPGQPSGAGGPPLSGLPSHKDKRKRPNAIAVVNPVTGADVIAEMLLDEASGGGISGGSAGQGRDNDHHHSQVAADFAARVAAVATENLVVPVAPPVTETPPPSSGSSIPSPAPAPTVIPSPEDVITSSPIIINGPQASPSCTPTPPPPVSLNVATQIVEQQACVVAPIIQPVISAPQPPPPSQAIPIVSAQTNSPAVDLHRPTQHVCVPPGSSPARKPSQQQTLQHAQVMQEPEVKPVKTKKDSRRPTPIPTPPPSLTNQQHHPSITSTLSGSAGVQIPSVVASAVHQQQHLSSSPAVHQVPPPHQQQQQQQQKEHHSTVSSNIPLKREQQPTVLPPLSSSSTHTVPTPHKSSFADSFDVKNFVVSQPMQQQQQQQQHRQHQEQKSTNAATPVAASSVTATALEQKETNGETDVHEAVSSNAAHPQSSHPSSHASNSALYVNPTKIMDKKRRRKSKTRSNNSNSSSSQRSSSRRRDSRDITNIVNYEQREQLPITFPPSQDLGGSFCRSNLGSKAVQRQKSKPMKKKDLNRKGGEKEGTDMDAFVGTSAPTAVTVVPITTGSVISTAQVSSGDGGGTAAAAVTTMVSTTNSCSTTGGSSPSSTPAVVTAASQQATSTVIQETVAPATESSSTTVITTTIVSTITSSSITATSTVPSSSSQSQTNRQPSPSLEKRLNIISTPFSKQPQDERDSNDSTSTSVTASSTSSSTISTSASIPTSVQVTPVTTPMSDDSDSSSIEAMVAAKNQENTKVSALLNNNNNLNNNNIDNINSNSNTTIRDNNNAKSIDDDAQNSIASGGDSPQASVTGTVIETMTIERSQPIQLMYNYKEGQWSPVNTEGKKVYDRDFLLEVRKNPLSTRKPDNIDPDVYRDKPHDTVLSNNNNRRNIHASNSMSLGTRGDNAVPTFMRSSQSQRGGGMISSKGGRGSGGGGGGPRMGGGGSMSGSMRDRDRMMGKGGGSSFGGPMSPFRGEEPQLHKTANSWKPSRNQDHKDKSDEEFKTEKLLKAVRGILNKLTPQKFETLLNQILALPIDTNERLTKVVHLVFSKAVDEPSFSKEYAELCRRLSLNKMPQQQSQEQQQGDQQQQQQHSASFRKLLLNKCQEEFEKNKTDELNIEARTKEIEECTDQEKKKELKLLLEEEERRIRIKKVGLVRFIGELYKLKMLTNKIMHGCITVLLDKIDEESLECLCKLLTTIGKELEQLSDKKDFDQYFQKMVKLSQKSPDPVVSSRIRFMLQDVIELRMKNWVPRRDENNPKTIEQIHKDAERETMLESALLSSQVGSGRSGGGGGGRHDSRDDRRGRQRGGAQSEDGWHSVGSGKNFTKNSCYPVEPSKLQHFKDIDNSMSLGSSYQWGQWTTGAGTKKSSNPQLHVNNKFAALGRSDQDERKPMSSMMNRKGVITPSPSLEKERSFSGVKEGLDRNSLSGGSTGRSTGNSGGSGPPSRESSRPRFGGGSSLSGAQQGSINSNLSGNQVAAGGSSISNQIPSVQPAAAAMPSAPLMDEEESERKTKTIIDEWLDNNNIQETVQTVQDTFVGIPNIVLFLRAALNLVLDHRKVIARPKTGHLLAVLVQENTIPHQELVKEFATLIEFGEDYKVDIPHVWKYIGEILGPVIAQEVFSFADIRSAAEPVRPSKGFTSTLAEIIRILIKEKGPGWIRTQWESSKVQMKDFVPEEDLDKFIKENSLGFIIGEGEVHGVTDSSLTPVMVEEKILSFLHKDNDKVLDHIGDWLNANVGEKTKENDFIKALTRAVIKASLKGDKLSSPKLLKNEKLIKKFVDNDEGRELTCLYSIQNLLINELVQAPGVLLETFQTLYENGTISRDAFLRWKEPRVDENICDKEHAGKGVALASLQSFFVSLSEQDDTDDEAPS